MYLQCTIVTGFENTKSSSKASMILSAFIEFEWYHKHMHWYNTNGIIVHISFLKEVNLCFENLQCAYKYTCVSTSS